MKLKIEFRNTLGQPTTAELFRALDRRPAYRPCDWATKTVATEGAK